MDSQTEVNSRPVANNGAMVYVLEYADRYRVEGTRGVFASEHEACSAVQDGSGGNWRRLRDGSLHTDYDRDGCKLIVRPYVVGQLV